MLKFIRRFEDFNVVGYEAVDSKTGSRYNIDETPDGKNRFSLNYIDENQIDTFGTCPVFQVGRFATVTEAAREANLHLEGVREDRAQRVVIQHPCMDGSLLSVFANDHTNVTEVIVNDDEGTSVLQLTREQVIALQSALGRVLDGTVAV